MNNYGDINDYGIRVDVLLPSDPIKPYHIKQSILSLKEVAERKKKIDANTNMNGPYKLDDLKFELFEEKPKTKSKALKKQNTSSN